MAETYDVAVAAVVVVGTLSDHVAGVAFDGVKRSAADLLDDADVVANAAVPVAVPVEGDDVAWSRRVVIGPPVPNTLVLQPDLHVVDCRDLPAVGPTAGKRRAGLLVDPAHEVSAPGFVAARGVFVYCRTAVAAHRTFTHADLRLGYADDAGPDSTGAR